MSNQTTYACSFKAIARKLNRVKINELLENADSSNEKSISSSIPKFRTDLKAPDLMTEKERISEDDYISVLKVELESLVVEDAELKDYYDGLQSRLNQKKIDEIYSIISADIPFHHTIKSHDKLATKAYPIKSNKHLTKKSTLSTNPRFEQETLIDGGENEISAEITDITSYVDEDFDTISEKIINGEIKIEAEDMNSSQLTLDGISEIQKKEESDEINLKIAFDMINNDEDETENASDEKESLSEGIFSRLFKYRSSGTVENNEENVEENNDEYSGFEYLSSTDKPEAEKLLKAAASQGLKKLIQSTLLFGALIILTFLFGKNGIFSNYLNYQRYVIPYVLIETQLLFLSVAIYKGSFIKGLLSFSTGKFTSDSVFTATVLFCTLHNVFSLFYSDSEIQLYNAVPMIMAVFMGLTTYLKSKKNIYSFKIISSDEEKYVASELSPTSKEASSFYSYLSEDSDVYTVSKTKFVSSFFKRISKRPQSEDILNIILPGVFFVSAIIFSICFFYGKMGIYQSFTATTGFFVSAMPITCVFVITLPLIAANNACKKIDSTIIGDSVAEEYSTASVISFEDKELFPESKVVMTNMKVYHNMRIDQIIVELAKLFSHIGGPLKGLFAKAVDGVFEEHSVIKVLESAENGIMIAADGVDYYLGNADFMISHSLSYEKEESDELYEKNGGSVMIFGANNVVAAKFYFKYTPQKGFKKLLNHMYNCGLCIGIKTLDPNINNNLLAYYADGSQCPISILKTSSPEEIVSIQDQVDTGIASKRSLGAFLKAFMLCDKARHSIKSNGIIMISGSLLTAILMIFISITGSISDFTPYYAFFFQILWSCAIFALSFLK